MCLFPENLCWILFYKNCIVIGMFVTDLSGGLFEIEIFPKF